MWAEGSAATGANDLAVAWFGASGNYISSNVSAPLPEAPRTGPSSAVDAVTPAQAAYAVLYLESSHNTGSVFFDDASVVY